MHLGFNFKFTSEGVGGSETADKHERLVFCVFEKDISARVLPPDSLG